MRNSWVFLLVVFAVGYLIGVKFPGTGQTVLSKVLPSAA
jgi:hypothetical protein